jgi:hypothetical protein
MPGHAGTHPLGRVRGFGQARELQSLELPQHNGSDRGANQAGVDYHEEARGRVRLVDRAERGIAHEPSDEQRREHESEPVSKRSRCSDSELAPRPTGHPPTRVTSPGERGNGILEERERSGIPLARGTWDRLLACARQLGVAAPQTMQNVV